MTRFEDELKPILTKLSEAWSKVQDRHYRLNITVDIHTSYESVYHIDNIAPTINVNVIEITGAPSEFTKLLQRELIEQLEGMCEDDSDWLVRDKYIEEIENLIMDLEDILYKNNSYSKKTEILKGYSK